MDEESFFNRLFDKIRSSLKGTQSENSIQPKHKQMEKSCLNVCSVLQADSLESSGEGVYLSQDQLQLIEDRLALQQQLVQEHESPV